MYVVHLIKAPEVILKLCCVSWNKRFIKKWQYVWPNGTEQDLRTLYQKLESCNCQVLLLLLFGFITILGVLNKIWHLYFKIFLTLMLTYVSQVLMFSQTYVTILLPKWGSMIVSKTKAKQNIKIKTNNNKEIKNKHGTLYVL